MLRRHQFAPSKLATALKAQAASVAAHQGPMALVETKTAQATAQVNKAGSGQGSKRVIAIRTLAAQFFNQAVELFEGAKLNRQLAHGVHFAVALHMLFHAHFHLRHQQV